MPKSQPRAYSRYTVDAASLLGNLIRVAKVRKLSAQELADRAAISRSLLLRIEKGDVRCCPTRFEKQ
jgi:predicted transcriptional regulator